MVIEEAVWMLFMGVYVERWYGIYGCAIGKMLGFCLLLI